MLKKLLLIISFTCLKQSYSFGQQQMTPSDIFQYWKKTNWNQVNSGNIIDSDSSVNDLLLKLSNSLSEDKIDSVMILSVAYPGSDSNSKCDTGIYPISTVVVWNHQGVTYVRSIQGPCVFQLVKSDLHVFDMSENQLRTAQSEMFMPVIFGGETSADGTTRISYTGLTHEPMYSFHFRIGTYNRSYHFSQSWLEDKRGMFWKHNTTMVTYDWWKRVTDKVGALN